MANIFYTNVFRTQENVNKDNMNYTVVDKDQKLSAYFPMPSANSGIFPGVICSGIGNIYNQFGFNRTTNTFLLTAGIIRFPDAISNNTPYNVTNQTASISQFLALDAPNPQPSLTTPLVANTYYLIATLQVTGSGSAYQYTNTSPTIPYTVIAKSTFTGVNQVALCLITIVGTTVTISTDVNCAVNYGITVPTIQRIIFTDVGTGSTKYLNPPTGATGVFITATAFGGNGGRGNNGVGGGGGGSGGGVNNLYYPIPSAGLAGLSVVYTPATTNPTASAKLTIPSNLFAIAVTLGNGGNGGDATTIDGNGGLPGTAIYLTQSTNVSPNIPQPPTSNGQNGGGGNIDQNGGNGGISIISPGLITPGGNGDTTNNKVGSNGLTFGSGAGGGAGNNISGDVGGTGGNAIVIAEWVF